jgi:hypothetical protein
LRHADRFADDHQEFERDPGPLADLSERLVGEGGEPLEAGRIDEVERQGAVLDRSDHIVERDPRALERSGHLHAAYIALREAIGSSGRQDAEIHKANEVGTLNPGSLSDVLA